MLNFHYLCLFVVLLDFETIWQEGKISLWRFGLTAVYIGSSKSSIHQNITNLREIFEHHNMVAFFFFIRALRITFHRHPLFFPIIHFYVLCNIKKCCLLHPVSLSDVIYVEVWVIVWARRGRNPILSNIKKKSLIPVPGEIY